MKISTYLTILALLVHLALWITVLVLQDTLAFFVWFASMNLMALVLLAIWFSNNEKKAEGNPISLNDLIKQLTNSEDEK